jgi:hypothetical protein
MLQRDRVAKELKRCCCSHCPAHCKAMLMLRTACRTLHRYRSAITTLPLHCHNSKPWHGVGSCHMYAAQQITTHAGILDMCHSKTAPAAPGKQQTPLVAAEHTRQQ